MYLIDHVAELRFVNRFIYAIKRIYTQQYTALVIIFNRCVRPIHGQNVVGVK